MSKSRVHSSPDLTPSASEDDYDDSGLEGVAANVKLLLKLIQDHNNACHKQKNDGRRKLRVATMMTILDNVRTRIQKCQFVGNKRSEAELRRCNTDVQARDVTRESKHGGDLVADEQEKLRKALNASLAARKSLEAMCSSLGKEKEIMESELAKKNHEVNEMEELISDLKEQNETLSEKVKECASEHRDYNKSAVGGAGLVVGADITQGHTNAILQERNRALSEHLLRSLDGYRSIKRKLKEAVEENLVARVMMEEMMVKFKGSLEIFRNFKEKIAASALSDPSVDDIQEEINQLENIFESLTVQVAKHGQKKAECMKVKGEIIGNPSKASVVV
ncbi:uncharacterized protein [Coffea arabica]|uniref:Uncharacterized protein n=1 Tax=Coffea arabica TaxID=13443 RepID=A0A6P6U8K6_COFAR|nr:uncharacterized protein LOC113708030 [Coffea arabica]